MWYIFIAWSLTHWILNKPTIIGSDNAFSPARRQAIIWTNARTLFIRLHGTKLNFNRNSYIFIQENPIQNVVWEITAILSRLQLVKQYCACDASWQNCYGIIILAAAVTTAILIVVPWCSRQQPPNIPSESSKFANSPGVFWGLLRTQLE